MSDAQWFSPLKKDARFAGHPVALRHGAQYCTRVFKTPTPPPSQHYYRLTPVSNIPAEQILARRQVERDAKTAADQAADVAKGLDEERQRKEEIERSAVEAAEKDKEALEMARVAAQAKKERQKELSRSPPRGP